MAMAAPRSLGQPPENFSPGAKWEIVAPESVGYSSARLNALRDWLKTENTTGMLVAVHGKVIFQYGDVSRVSVVASVRMVIAHKVDLDPYPHRGEITPVQWNTILSMVLAAKCESDCATTK